MRFNELRQTLTLRMSNVAAALRDAESETPVADRPAHNRITDSYQFNGFLGDIYSTLVARLHHSHPFERDQLWLIRRFPVMLVIMDSNWNFKNREWRQLDGARVCWMEVRNYLKENPSARSVEFSRERFGVMSVRRWREKGPN